MVCHSTPGKFESVAVFVLRQRNLVAVREA